MSRAVAEPRLGARAALAHMELARQVAQRAAETLLAEPSEGRMVRQELRRDVKIAADLAAHRLIGEALSLQSPFPILSEEDEASHRLAGQGGYRWIVDPLDGSLNFARGIPWSCISIALWRGMTPVVGVVYDLHRREMFSGMEGSGAWLNDTRIRVSDVTAPQQAILCTGFPVQRAYDAPSLHAFVTQIQTYKKIRLLGSAALSLAYVACGRADAYEEEQIALWDVAAGIAIVRAAGGVAHVQRSGEGPTVTVRAGNRDLVPPAASPGEGAT